jgi:hypothetical protein
VEAANHDREGRGVNRASRTTRCSGSDHPRRQRHRDGHCVNSLTALTRSKQPSTEYRRGLSLHPKTYHNSAV